MQTAEIKFFEIEKKKKLKPCSVDSGVPQGSVLGPLLFLCHINDLPQRVTSKVRLFADDCLLYKPIHSPHDQLLLQQDLAALETWAEVWGMRFNVSKCYFMSIHGSKHPYSSYYKLDNHILEQVEENPYLGLTIHKSLKWASHINKISNKANSVLGFIKRNLKHTNRDLRELAYTSLVRSILDYIILFYSLGSILPKRYRQVRKGTTKSCQICA